MIINLTVENFVIIENVSLDFHEGFSAFTGETGAGKSLIIDALGILLGNRFSIDYLKKDRDKCRIEIAVELTNNQIDILNNNGIVCDEVNVFTKELDKSNKSISRINGRVVTATLMKEVLSQTIDIHSQYDNQYLLSKKYHLGLLDRYLNSSILLDLSKSYKLYKELLDKYEELKNKKYHPSELEFLEYQLAELNELDLKENEISNLENRFKLLSSLEKSTTKLNDSINLMDNNNVIGVLWQAIKDLESTGIEDLNEIISSLKDGYYNIEDNFVSLKSFIENVDFSENEINSIQSRLFDIKKIQKKFGFSYSQIMESKENIQANIEEIHNSDIILQKLEKELIIAKNEYIEIAKKYSKQRKDAALKLEKEIIQHLLDLDLPHSKFKVFFKEKNMSIDGIDDIEFLLSTNLNMVLRPLNKVASGGELSRIMLGLKIIFSNLQGTKTIIFDEIDTGVSGPTAFSIGQKMKELSKVIQVFTITHLAQVAANSEYHYYVEKEIVDQQTVTQVKLLDEDERINQLAILGFGSVDENSYLAAKDLLNKGLSND